MKKQFNGGKLAFSSSLFNNEGFGNPQAKMNFYLNIAPYTKINLKWISNVKIICKTIKLIVKESKKKFSGSKSRQKS